MRKSKSIHVTGYIFVIKKRHELCYNTDKRQQTKCERPEMYMFLFSDGEK